MTNWSCDCSFSISSADEELLLERWGSDGMWKDEKWCLKKENINLCSYVLSSWLKSKVYPKQNTIKTDWLHLYLMRQGLLCLEMVSYSHVIKHGHPDLFTVCWSWDTSYHCQYGIWIQKRISTPGGAKKFLPNYVQILAMATIATVSLRKCIIKMLCMHSPIIVYKNVDKSNLILYFLSNLSNQCAKLYLLMKLLIREECVEPVEATFFCFFCIYDECHTCIYQG